MARRGPGEGGVYQRADGRWVGAVGLGWVGGRRRRKVVYGKTRREAREKLAEVRTAIEAGIAVDRNQQTVEQFLKIWLDQVVRPNLRPKTIRTYATVVHVHLVPRVGRIRLARLSAQDVQTMLNAVASLGRSPRTVQMVRAVLRQALAYAVRWSLVARNVATLVAPPRAVPAERRPFSISEARLFVIAVHGDRDEALYLVALATGMRQSEVLGLRWSEVDLDAGQARVSKALSRISGTRLVDTKTERSRGSSPSRRPSWSRCVRIGPGSSRTDYLRARAGSKQGSSSRPRSGLRRTAAPSPGACTGSSTRRVCRRSRSMTCGTAARP